MHITVITSITMTGTRTLSTSVCCKSIYETHKNIQPVLFSTGCIFFIGSKGFIGIMQM